MTRTNACGSDRELRAHRWARKFAPLSCIVSFVMVVGVCPGLVGASKAGVSPRRQSSAVTGRRRRRQRGSFTRPSRRVPSGRAPRAGPPCQGRPGERRSSCTPGYGGDRGSPIPLGRHGGDDRLRLRRSHGVLGVSCRPRLRALLPGGDSENDGRSRRRLHLRPRLQHLVPRWSS